jgi:hypothetical protein
MSGMAQDFTWTATVAVDWSNPANWADVSTGRTPAVTPPGASDFATIGGSADTITGTGAANSLVIQDFATMLADLNVGTISATGGFEVFGTAITAQTVIAGGTVVAEAGGTIAAGVLVTSNLVATNGGVIQADALTVQSGTIDLHNGIPGDINEFSGIIEVGQSGTGLPGELTIDPGYTMQAGTVTIDTTTEFPVSAQPSASLVVNGLHLVSDVTVGVYSPDATFTFPATTEYVPTDLGGTGTIEVEPNGTLDLIAQTPTSGPTLQLDGDAILILQGNIAPGTTINLIGTGNTMKLSSHLPAVQERLTHHLPSRPRSAASMIPMSS